MLVFMQAFLRPRCKCLKLARSQIRAIWLARCESFRYPNIQKKKKGSERDFELENAAVLADLVYMTHVVMNMTKNEQRTSAVTHVGCLTTSPPISSAAGGAKTMTGLHHNSQNKLLYKPAPVAWCRIRARHCTQGSVKHRNDSSQFNTREGEGPIFALGLCQVVLLYVLGLLFLHHLQWRGIIVGGIGAKY
jgi:hypothetical protein